MYLHAASLDGKFVAPVPISGGGIGVVMRRVGYETKWSLGWLLCVLIAVESY